MSTLENFRLRSAAPHFVKAAYASVRAAASGDTHRGGAAGVAAQLWPDSHKAAAMLLRGAVSPTDTTSAAAMALSAVGDFIASLAPLSAASRLIAAGVSASLEGIATTKFPKRVGGKAAADVAWVREGNAIPVRTYALDDVELGPARKLASISVVTREVVEHTNGETVVGTLLREDFAASLDAAMFSDTAADDTRPAGLLLDLTPLTGSAATSPTEAMNADLEALAGAIADEGGVDVMFIASPRQANAARIRLGANRSVNIWPSAALSAGTVIAIEPLAFVSAFGAIPRFTSSLQTALHMDDNPSAISAVGTPNTVSAPNRSMFQTDCIAIKAILDAAWTMRAEGRVTYLTDATWGAAP